MNGDSEAGDAGVRFADIQRVLAIFTEGIAGRHLPLRPLAEAAPGERPATIGTDGEGIDLPSSIADFTEPRHNCGAYRVAILHQIGFLECGTFSFDLELAAIHMVLPSAPAEGVTLPEVLRRHPMRQGAPLERFFALSPRPMLLRRLFTLLEDLRVDSAMRRRYPGVRADLDRVLGHALAQRPEVDPARPLRAMLELLTRFSLGADATALAAADATGRAAAMLALAARVMAPEASVYDSARAALMIDAMLCVTVGEPVSGMDPDPRDEEAPAADADAPQQKDGPSIEAAGDAAAAGDADGPGVAFRGELRPDQVYRRTLGGKGGAVPEATAAQVADDTECGAPDVDAAIAARASVRAAGAARTATARSFLYDEWDCHHATFLKGWCRVHESRLSGGDAVLVHAARREHAALARQVRRQFALIRPESWRRVHRASEGDSFDLDRVIEAAIDRRAGIVADDFLYVRRERALREVAAAFLVDMSASTDFPVPEPEPHDEVPADTLPSAGDLYLWGRDGVPVEVAPPARRRRVIDVERDALVLMCDALRILGDSHAVYGFSGSGRDNVEFHIAKDFGDAPGTRTWGALAAMAPRRSTRMGPAVRHAAAKLKRQPQRRRVMIIVSDGYPEDIDYGPDRRDRGYGIEDTASALREAEGAGIATFCITVDRAGHDYLRRMCAEDRYLVIDEVAALPQALSKVYRALTA